MKKLFTILVFLFVCNIGFAQKIWYGTINDNIFVVLRMEKPKLRNNVLLYQGTLKYGKSEKSLIIKGEQLETSSNLTLNEFDENNNLTGIWIGKYSSEEGNPIITYSGTWSNPDGTRKYKFKVTFPE